MIGHLRITSPYRQLGVLLLVFSPQLFLLFFGLFINKEVESLQPLSDATIQQIKWSQALSSVLFFFLPAYLFALFTFQGKRLYFLGMKKAEHPSMYVIAVFGILFLLPFVFFLGELNSLVPLPSWMKNLEVNTGNQLEAILKVKNNSDIIVNLFIIAFLPALCEEVFFRGAMQRVLIHITARPWMGILLTALLFSAFHLQFAGFFPRFFLGMVLGFLYWYSGSIWTSFAAHFANNGIQVLVVSFYPEYIKANPSVPLLHMLGFLGTGTLLLHLVYKQSNVSFAKVYETEKLTPHNEFIA
jgi:hypothetical protein